MRNTKWLCTCRKAKLNAVRSRSTLDPVLRLEQKGINPQGLGLVALLLAYLTATPGKA